MELPKHSLKGMTQLEVGGLPFVFTLPLNWKGEVIAYISAADDPEDENSALYVGKRNLRYAVFPSFTR